MNLGKFSVKSENLAKKLAGLAKNMRSTINSTIKIESESGYLTKLKNAFQKVVEECSLTAVAHRTIANCSKGFKQR